MSDELNRRNFIKRVGIGAATAALTDTSQRMYGAKNRENSQGAPYRESNPAWPSGTTQFHLDMVAYAHIDAVWLWPWSKAMSVVLSTFRSALDRMKSHPDFTFSETSAQFYKWVAENDSAMLEEIRQRIDEGRWDLLGGWWVEPDVNMPNGESLARQGLFGQRLFRQLFGRQAKVAANPDSFGHTGTLPQILKLQEMEDYIFMRPNEAAKYLPADIFWWEGPDGTRVLAYRLISYGGARALDRRVRQVIGLREPDKDLMVFYGAGDHGGGATDKNISSIQKIMAEPGAPKLIYSTPDKYIARIRARKDLGLPTVPGDLQHHAVGCYTAVSQVKKDNRTTEMALATAEKIASLGSIMWGAAYPQAEFHAAWEKVLFQQFHDSLAGSALPKHYVQPRHAYGYAQEVANQAILLSLEKLAWQVAAEDPQSDCLVVFNPHAWNTRLNVEYDLGWHPEVPSELTDERGRSVAHQWVQASTVTFASLHKLVFQAPLPAFGYRQFRLRKANSKQAAPAGVHASPEALENDHLRVSFSEDGTIGIFDKDAGQEVFERPTAGARAVVLDDPSDTWSHGVVSYAHEVGTFGGAELQVMESGPFRGRVRMRSRYQASSLETD